MQRAVIILAVLVGLLLMKDACVSGGVVGWFARASFDEHYEVLPKHNGVPVVPSNTTIILQRGGGSYEVPADQGYLPQIVIRPPAANPQPQVTVPAPATQLAPQQQPRQRPQPPAPKPCSPQEGCPGDDGFQTIRPRTN